MNLVPPIDLEMEAGEPEAFATLVARVGRKATQIAPEALADHVMRIVPRQEWPVRVEALDAILRRLDFAKKDGLRINKRPEQGAVLGAYGTRRRGAVTRPYNTVLSGLRPLGGLCDCPDYLKNSLGLCKHLLIIANDLYSKPQLLHRGLREQGRRSDQPRLGLAWDPIRPLQGFGDWLERITWTLGDDPQIRGGLAKAALAWFQHDRDGTWRLKRSFIDQPAKRLEIVRGLIKILSSPSAGASDNPALRALLFDEQESLARVTTGAVDTRQMKASVKKLKRSLYSYQEEGVKRFLQAGRLLLADDMGLGKTAQAIACCDVLWRLRKIRRGLIIAPAALKSQWAREWDQFSDLPVRIIDGTPADRQAIYAKTKEGLFIINYEQLLRDMDAIQAWKADLVVLDEAQRIKNWATKTAISVKRLDPPYRLVLTGTPMENRIEELASIVEWVDDHALEPKWRLAPLHAIKADGRKETIGVRNLETIRQRLRPCMVRRVRQEVLDQLPPRTDTRIPVAMTDGQMASHDSLNQPIIQLMAIAEKRPLTQAQFLRLMSLLTTQRIISNGLAQLDFKQSWPSLRALKPEEAVLKSLDSPKLTELRQLVRNLVIDQGRKIVIFSQWRRMLKLAHWSIADILAENGLRAGFFTGHEKQARRTQNLVEFHDDPEFRILLASDAGGVGLNLQRAANCVINIELPWNPAVLEQRIGRIYRLGQTQPIDVYNLVSEPGIESRIADIVGNKQAFFKGLFDGESDSIKFEQSGTLLSRIKKLYDPSIIEAVAGSGSENQVLDEAIDLTDDDGLGDPLDEMIEAGDESEDLVTAEPSVPEAETVPAFAAPAAEPDAWNQHEHESDGAPLPDGERKKAALPHANEVRQLFSQLQVRRETSGKIHIEAPAEVASTLSALFEGIASLLQSASEPPAD